MDTFIDLVAACDDELPPYGNFTAAGQMDLDLLERRVRKLPDDLLRYSLIWDSSDLQSGPCDLRSSKPQ